MIGVAAGVLLAVAGLAAAGLAGRHLSARWAPAVLGGVTGGFGVGALRVSGHGDIPLLALSGVMVVYGLLVGLAAMLARRTG